MQKNFIVNGRRLDVRIQGTGRPLLLVHGFPLDHKMWRHQIEHFSHFMQVIAPDLIGYGTSGPEDRVQLTMNDYADDLAELITQLMLQSSVTYCGLSMGGYIGWQFLQTYGHLVDRVIQCNTRSAADDEKTARGRRLAASQVLKHGVSEIVSHMPIKLLGPNAPSLLASEIRQVIIATPPETIAAGQLAMAMRPNMTDFLPKINQPTLLIGGDDDTITPSKEMESMSQSIPNVVFVSIPGVGHMTPLEAPQQFNGIVEQFLEQTNGQ